MSSETSALPVRPLASVTTTSMTWAPAVIGVPESSPVPERSSPAGRAPGAVLKTNGALPPVATSCSDNAAPASPVRVAGFSVGS